MDGIAYDVSMKSGLEGRNNMSHRAAARSRVLVSMKSGLEGRNNKGLVTLAKKGEDPSQ